jgi:hypothetical protein
MEKLGLISLSQGLAQESPILCLADIIAFFPFQQNRTGEKTQGAVEFAIDLLPIFKK